MLDSESLLPKAYSSCSGGSSPETWCRDAVGSPDRGPRHVQLRPQKFAVCGRSLNAQVLQIATGDGFPRPPACCVLKNRVAVGRCQNRHV